MKITKDELISAIVDYVLNIENINISDFLKNMFAKGVSGIEQLSVEEIWNKYEKVIVKYVEKHQKFGDDKYGEILEFNSETVQVKFYRVSYDNDNMVTMD